MNIVEILVTTIKAKLMPVLNKIKLLTNKSFLKNKLLVRIRNFFFRLLDVRPRDEKDYYTFLGWLVSRRLAMAAVIVIIVLCSGFLWTIKPQELRSGHPYKAYKYDSLMLKFSSGKVRILGKSGYTAYIGDIEKGTVKGVGTLYNPEGCIVYEGEFDANAYNGTGKKYYENSQLEYEGTFKDNLYEGEGKLYRENATLRYEGNFHLGHMMGEGTLYGASQEPVYKGHFKEDTIVYQELLGKSTADIAQMYLGAREIVTATDVYEVYMRDIGAIYFGADSSNTLDEEFKVDGVYVLQKSIHMESEIVKETTRLAEFLGEPVYEGNTYLEPRDEIALNKACASGGADVLHGKSEYKETKVYDDVTQAQDFEGNYQAYIYVYEKEGIVYTFFCKDKETGFDFYMLEK